MVISGPDMVSTVWPEVEAARARTIDQLQGRSACLRYLMFVLDRTGCALTAGAALYLDAMRQLNIAVRAGDDAATVFANLIHAEGRAPREMELVRETFRPGSKSQLAIETRSLLEQYVDRAVRKHAELLEHERTLPRRPIVNSLIEDNVAAQFWPLLRRHYQSLLLALLDRTDEITCQFFESDNDGIASASANFRVADRDVSTSLSLQRRGDGFEISAYVETDIEAENGGECRDLFTATFATQDAVNTQLVAYADRFISDCGRERAFILGRLGLK